MTKRRALLITVAMIFGGSGAFAQLTDQSAAPCEAFATRFYRTENPKILPIHLQRSEDAMIDRFDSKIGVQPVATAIWGVAEFKTEKGRETAHYLCLLESDKKAVAFLFLPDFPESAGFADAQKACQSKGTALTACLDQSQRAAEEQMNKALETAKAKYRDAERTTGRKGTVENLTASQSAWMEYRKQTCALRGRASGSADAERGCILGMTGTRTRDLIQQ